MYELWSKVNNLWMNRLLGPGSSDADVRSACVQSYALRIAAAAAPAEHWTRAARQT